MGNACTTESSATPWCGGREIAPDGNVGVEDVSKRGEISAPSNKSTNTSKTELAAPPSSNSRTIVPPKDTSTQTMKNFRVLLVGAGESGKTTFTQQLTLIYNMSQLSVEDRKASVLTALLENIKSVINSVYANAKAMQIHDSAETVTFEKIANARVINEEFAMDVKHIWGKQWMKRSFQCRTSFWVLDTAQWLIDNVERFAKPDFIPTQDDVLKSRRRTTGITEHQYIVGDTTFTIIDVGGQRSERRKWVQFFSDVHCIIFFVSAIGFANVLFEDQNTTQMKESLDLFAKTFRVPQAVPHAGKIDNDWTDYVFETTPIHLIFNKMDMLPETLRTYPEKFKSTFPLFKGNIGSLREVTDFMNRQFIERVVSIRSPPDTHFISAMNQAHVEGVFTQLSKFLIEKEKTGLALNAFMAKENNKNKKDDKKGISKEDAKKKREKRVHELNMPSND